MQQRYYDPLIPHFLSVDPVTAYSAGGAFNRYWYASANPYGFIDPDGRDPDPGMDPYRLSGGFVGVRSPGPVSCDACDRAPRQASSASTSTASTSSGKQEEPSTVPTASIVATVFKTLADSNGTFAGLMEQYLVSNGMWRGSNGKMYDLGWGGNQHTGARSLVLEEAGKLRAFGQGLFFLSSGISIVEGGFAAKRGDGFGVFKSGVDIGWGAAATYGGPAGVTGAATYTGTSWLIQIPVIQDHTVRPLSDRMCSLSGNC